MTVIKPHCEGNYTKACCRYLDQEWAGTSWSAPPPFLVGSIQKDIEGQQELLKIEGKKQNGGRGAPGGACGGQAWDGDRAEEEEQG